MGQSRRKWDNPDGSARRPDVVVDDADAAILEIVTVTLPPPSRRGGQLIAPRQGGVLAARWSHAPLGTAGGKKTFLYRRALGVNEVKCNDEFGDVHEFLRIDARPSDYHAVAAATRHAADATTAPGTS